MAEKIVKGIDIVEKGALSEHIEQAKQLLVVYKQLDDEVKSTATSLAKMSKGFKATKTGDVGTAKATSDNMNKALIEQERLEQAQIRTKKALLQLEKAQQQQANKTAKAIKDEGNAYKQQSKTLTDLINRYQNLAARGRENGKVAKGLLTEITKLDNGLKKIDATVGRHQRNVGNYKSALNGLRGAASKVTNVLGQLGLAMGVGMVIRNTVNIVKDFEQANANLASILGVTTEQTKKLQDQQLLLGGSTSYTAAQVAELQTEYAKLGFTNQEILAATEGTLFLAKAAGVDLARAAEVAGSTLRGFGLDATETGRVTDVMALSFSKSALDMEKFAEAMKYVAPIAKVAGLTIEETTAMLGALANAGISGSNAGTALRQVLSEMDKTGKTTSEALQDLATKGLNLADAEDEVGKNAKTALLVLTDQTKQTAELTTVLNGAAGSAKAMAEVQDNTLKGSIDRLSSAWEAWILNLNRSSGAGKSLRNVIEFLARNLVTILNVVVKVGKAFLIYKSAMMAIRVATVAQVAIEKVRTNGLKSMFVQQTAVNGATEKGTGAVKLFGKTINAVPIAMLITGLTILVTELLNMESASAAAARALDEVTESTKLLNEEILSAIENTKTQYQDNITQRIETLKNAGKTEKEIQEDITSNYIVELEKRKKALEEILAPDTGVSMMTMDILAQNFQQGQQIPLDNPMGVNPNQKTKYQAVVDEARNERIAAFKKELDEINLLLQSEKAREESSKKLIDNYKEVNVIEGKINSNREKSKEELSEMAKLEKQLQEIQLERSNLIIRQKGKESDRTLELKLQERELKKQIDRYKEIIEAANKLERVAPIGAVLNTGGTMTTQEQADKMLEDAQREFDYFNDQKEEKAEQLAQAQIQLAQDLTDITTFLTDKRIEAIDREIEAEKRKYEESKQNIDAIIAMREMDSNSMAQSIAFEKAEQAKALAAQEKLQRKKQRLELLNTSIGMLNAQIAAGNGNPLGKTMADVTTLIGFIKSIPMFWEGTETTVGDSVGTKFSNGRDGILARVDKSEMILNKSKVDKLAAMGIHSTDDVVKRLMLGNGISNVPTSMVAMNDNSDVVNELAEHRALLKQLVNKPVTNTTLEQVGKVVKMIETVNKPHRNIVTVKQKRIS
jgi:hypothetical protein